MNDNPTAAPGRTRKIALAAGVGLAGVVAGGVLATALSASAESSDGDTRTRGYGAPGAPGSAGGERGDGTRPDRPQETPLTGTTKAKVVAAVEAKYPDATIDRVETDSEGVYEAHITDDGKQLVVQVGKDFTITGTQELSGHGPGGHGPGGRGDHDGDRPDGPASPEATS